MRVVLAIVFVLCACAPGLSVPSTAPPSLASPSADVGPTPRSGADLVWHDRLRSLLLVNGTGARGSPQEIWSFDGTVWRLVQRGGLERRDMGLVVYDRTRDRIVLFGGRVGANEKVFTDTWEWNGATWQQRAGTPGEASNHLHGTFFAKGSVAMFSGAGDTKGRALAETWGFDANGWRRLADTTPPSRAHYAIGYDGARERAVLFGGFDGTRDRGDLWEWDGSRWSEIALPGAPSPRAGMRMAYDSEARHMVLFGGGNGRSNTDRTTFTYDGRAWTALTAQGPTARGYGAMAYDPVRKRVVYFGGYDGAKDLGDTWEFDGTSWRQVG